MLSLQADGKTISMRVGRGTVKHYVDLRKQFLALQRQYAASMALLSAVQVEAHEMCRGHWPKSAHDLGRAVIQNGSLRLSNAGFDRLNRESVIGPPWRACASDEWRAQLDDPWPTLTEVALQEARTLLAEGGPRREGRFARGNRVIKLVTELARPSAGGETIVLVSASEAGTLLETSVELALLRERLAEKQRTAAVGELALAVAHDLGNLVGALRARLMVFEPRSLDDHEHLESLGAIVDAQSALVAKLRTSATPATGTLTALDLLVQVIRPAIQMVESRLQAQMAGRQLLIRVDPSLASLPTVLGVRDDLVNVVINLLLNATDAMPRGGTIHVTGDADHREARLRIDDEGGGIPPELLHRIFRPMFTTKGSAGTGMGLAIARDALVRAGGNITASNRPAGGARFELRFRLAAPVIQAPADIGQAVG